MSSGRSDHELLNLAARHALRGFGDVEPNPMVGAVLVREGRVIGIGHHRRYGGPHAEIEALADARRRGEQTAGATLFCTLEPCTHHGKTPPCTDAIQSAGITAVVIAHRDPSPHARGGIEILRARGIEVRQVDAPWASAVVAPFVHRLSTGRPLVIAKWAQTIDGRIATRTGESRWITGDAARRRVHRLRARVDAILTGIGTVQADDPLLTARGVKVHRVARRVVIDTRLRLSPTSQIVRSRSEAPVTIFYNPGELALTGDPVRLQELTRPGLDLVSAPMSPQGLDMRAALRILAQRYDTSTVLVEAGPRLLGAMLDADLIDVAVIYIAPKVLADGDAMPVATGRMAPRLADARPLQIVRVKRCGADVELLARRPPRG